MPQYHNAEIIESGKAIGVDLTIMLDVFSGLNEEFREMVSTYLEDQAGLIAQLEDTVAHCQWREASRTAHRLAGGANAVGAYDFAKHCSGIELKISKGDYNSAAEDAESVKERFEIVQNFLKRAKALTTT